MNSNGYFPLFFDLSRRRILVAGAGQIALRRICTLLAFTENIEVVAEKACPEVEALAQNGRIRLHLQKFTPEYPVRGYDLVLACTNDEELNSGIYRLCREAGIWVNNCGNQEECDFFCPSVVKRGPLVIGINAAGTDHKQVKDTRLKIEEIMGGNDAHYNRNQGESSGTGSKRNGEKLY